MNCVRRSTPSSASPTSCATARDIPDEQRKDLDIINRSGEHLLALINDVLDVAKIEAGRIVVENAPCDVQSLVRDITEMMQVRAKAKNLQLLVEQSPRFPTPGPDRCSQAAPDTDQPDGQRGEVHRTGSDHPAVG